MDESRVAEPASGGSVEPEPESGTLEDPLAEARDESGEPPVAALVVAAEVEQGPGDWTPGKVPPDDRRCHATSAMTGNRCRNWAVRPTGVCRFHGASALRGIASHFFKTGKASKYIPKKLRPHYIAALRDPALDNLKNQIALLEARESELLTRIGTGESDGAWEDARQAMLDLLEATRAGDKNKSFYAVERLKRTILAGSDEKRQWDEIRENMELRRRLVETERKREEYLRANITPEILASLMGRVCTIIKQYVEDRRVLSRIADDIRAAAFGEQFIIDGEVVEEAIAGGEAGAAGAEA